MLQESTKQNIILLFFLQKKNTKTLFIAIMFFSH